MRGVLLPFPPYVSMAWDCVTEVLKAGDGAAEEARSL